jgi:hypothetical protein
MGVMGAIWTIFAVGYWVVETAFKYLALPALAVFGVYIFLGLMHAMEELSIDLRALRGSVEDIKTAIDSIKRTLADVKDRLEDEMDDVPDVE